MTAMRPLPFHTNSIVAEKSKENCHVKLGTDIFGHRIDCRSLGFGRYCWYRSLDCQGDLRSLPGSVRRFAGCRTPRQNLAGLPQISFNGGRVALFVAPGRCSIEQDPLIQNLFDDITAFSVGGFTSEGEGLKGHGGI
jgi:hypothetical protein